MMATTPAVMVTTRYLGPTNHRGSRIRAVLPSGTGMTVAWDHALDVGQNHEAAARALVGVAGGDAKAPAYRGLLGKHDSMMVFCFPGVVLDGRASVLTEGGAA